MRQIYSYQEARKRYNVTNGAQFKDVETSNKAFLRLPVYDTLTVSGAGGLQNLSFFTTLGDVFKTNMSLQGVFPQGQDFLVWNIQPYFEPGVPNSEVDTVVPLSISDYTNDVATFYNNAIVTVNILSQKWLQAPAQMMPPANRLVGSSSYSASQFVADSSFNGGTQIASWGGEAFDVNGFWIPSNTNIEVVVSFNEELPSGQNGTLRMTMDGVMYRNVQ